MKGFLLLYVHVCVHIIIIHFNIADMAYRKIHGRHCVKTYTYFFCDENSFEILLYGYTALKITHIFKN